MSDFTKMTPAERAIKKGYGDEDNPAYCDVNGKCFEYEEDAKYVDKIIKENEKFKEENEKISKSMYDLNMSYSKTTQDAENTIIKQNKEILELEEEIEKKDESIAFWEGKSEDKKDTIKKLKEEITHKNNKFSEWIEENKELKEENEKLEEGMNIMGGLQKGIDIDNKKLKEENKKLKEERQESMTILQEANSDIIGDIKKGLTKEKLKKENKKLKEENETLQEHYNNSIHTDWIAEAAGEDKEYYRDVCCAETLGMKIKENKKLKEENAKLKEEHETHIHNLQKSYEVLKSEFQEKRDSLQRHNEILMEQLCGSYD